MDLKDWDVAGYCKRIRLLRRLHGMNQTQFAAFLEIPYKKWHHYERGYPVSRETAFVLHKKVEGFSTDWLWFGDTRAIAPGTLKQLQAFEAEERRRLAPTKPLPRSEVRKRLSKATRRRRVRVVLPPA
jgi:transcriptional regulator with XRE-family HTH domain